MHIPLLTMAKLLIYVSAISQVTCLSYVPMESFIDSMSYYGLVGEISYHVSIRTLYRNIKGYRGQCLQVLPPGVSLQYPCGYISYDHQIIQKGIGQTYIRYLDVFKLRKIKSTASVLWQIEMKHNLRMNLTVTHFALNESITPCVFEYLQLSLNYEDDKTYCGNKASWEQVWHSNNKAPFHIKFIYVHVGRDSFLTGGNPLYTGKFQLVYQVLRERHSIVKRKRQYLSTVRLQYPYSSESMQGIAVTPQDFRSFDGMLSYQYTITTNLDLKLEFIIRVGDAIKHYIKDGAHPHSSNLLPKRVEKIKYPGVPYAIEKGKKFYYPPTTGFLALVRMDVIDPRIKELHYPAFIMLNFTYNEFQLTKLWQGDNTTKLSISQYTNNSAIQNAMIEGYEIEQVSGFYIKLSLDRFHADGPNTETCNHWGMAIYDSDRFRLIRETKSNWNDPHIKSYRPLLLLCHTMWFRNIAEKQPYITVHVSGTANVRILWYTFSPLFTKFEVDLTVETSKCRGIYAFCGVVVDEGGGSKDHFYDLNDWVPVQHFDRGLPIVRRKTVDTEHSELVDFSFCRKSFSHRTVEVGDKTMNLCIRTQHDPYAPMYFVQNTFHLRSDCAVIITEGHDVTWKPFQLSCSMKAFSGRLQTGGGSSKATTDLTVKVEDSVFCWKNIWLYLKGLTDIYEACHVGISEVTSTDALQFKRKSLRLYYTYMSYIFPRHFSRPANSTVTIGAGNSWVFGSYQCNLLVQSKVSYAFELANRDADVTHCTDLLLFVTKVQLVVSRQTCRFPCFVLYIYTSVPLREKELRRHIFENKYLRGRFIWRNLIEIYKICSINFESIDLMFYSIFETRRFYIKPLDDHHIVQPDCQLDVHINQLINIYQLLPVTINIKPTNDYNMPEKIYYILWKNTTVSWNQAEAMCESMGGHLPSLSSKTEADFIERLVLGLRFNASLPLYHSPLRYFPFTGIYLGFDTDKVCPMPLYFR